MAEDIFRSLLDVVPQKEAKRSHIEKTRMKKVEKNRPVLYYFLQSGDSNSQNYCISFQTLFSTNQFRNAPSFLIKVEICHPSTLKKFTTLVSHGVHPWLKNLFSHCPTTPDQIKIFLLPSIKVKSINSCLTDALTRKLIKKMAICLSNTSKLSLV